METVDIKIGDKKYTVSLARTDEEKEKGLMGVETLPENQGMLFDYSDSPQKELSFWMKGTLIPLDIIFINNQGLVAAVAQGEPESEEQIECVSDDDELLMYVLEVNIHSGIKIGDRFEMNFEEAKSKGLVNDEGEPIDDESDEDIEDVSEEDIKMFILNSKGKPVHEVEPGVRIFSRIHTRELIRLVKHANKTKEDRDYKRLGKKLFKILDIQNSQEPEYVNSPKSSED